MATKIVSAQHTGLVQVHQYCAARPYVELKIPSDSEQVLAVTFETVSRDQGWADSNSPSFTWFEAELLRPPGRPSVATLHLNRNAAGDPKFRTGKVSWNSQDINSSSVNVRTFHQELQSDDVIQLCLGAPRSVKSSESTRVLRDGHHFLARARTGGRVVPPIWNKLGRERNVPLLDLFLATLDMRATDPRDRLFALFGLSHEINGLANTRIALHPDYTKTLEKTMADFTRWCIIKQRSLRVLSMIHCQPSRGWRCTVPVSSNRSTTGATWALSSEGYSTWADMNLLSRFPSLNVAGDLEPDSSLVVEDFESDPPVLKLRGRRIGAIETIGYPPRSMLASFEAVAVGDVQLKPSALSVFVHLFDPCGYHGSWTRPLERTPQHSVNFRESPMVYYDHLKAHHAYFPSPRAQVFNEHTVNGPSFELADVSHIPSCIHPCYFLATSGHRGLCPWAARVGDVIVTLHGGRVPYLLRPVALHTTTYFEFVGECFVEDGTPVSGYKVEVFKLI